MMADKMVDKMADNMINKTADKNTLAKHDAPNRADRLIEGFLSFFSSSPRQRIIFIAMILLALSASFFFLMLCSQPTEALGVSPGRKTVDFLPGQSLGLEMSVINPEGGEGWAILSTEGEIKDLLFLEETELYLKPGAFRNPFKLMIRFPSEMEPGLHSGKIIISPLLGKGEEGSLSAFVTPVISINIRVPYPSKYADASLYVVDVDEGTPIPIYIQFDNIGSEDILRAGAEMDITAPDGTIISTITAGPSSVLKGAFIKIPALPSIILRKGAYSATVRAYYDDERAEFISNFTIGEPVIRIIELDSRFLAYGQINKVPFKVRNEWNAPLAVKGFIAIGEKQSEMPGFILNSEEERELEGFLDTTGLPKGDFNMTITLAYGSQVKKEDYLITIVDKELTEEKKPSDNILLMLGLAVLILSFAAFIFLLIRKKTRNP